MPRGSLLWHGKKNEMKFVSFGLVSHFSALSLPVPSLVPSMGVSDTLSSLAS